MITLHTCTIIFYLEYFILRLILPLISYLVFLLQLFCHVILATKRTKSQSL